MTPYLVCTALAVLAVGFLLYRARGPWAAPGRADDLDDLPVGIPAIRPPESHVAPWRCPLDQCRIRTPHSHTEALLRRIRES